MSLKYFYRIVFWFSVAGVALLIFDLGFFHSEDSQIYIDQFYFLTILLGVIATIFRYIHEPIRFKKKALFLDSLVLLFVIFLVYIRLSGGAASFYFENNTWIEKQLWIKFVLLFTFIREFSEQKINFKSTRLNPAQLFFASYLIVILIGMLLLKLPNATVEGISIIDALFTSTSAVCITGLVVFDTSTEFTAFGQFILLILFQIGALGILTFASYFSYFFKGGASYENQLVLGEITNSQKIGEVFLIFKKIIVITLVIEFISSLAIFLIVDEQLFDSHTEHLFFSVFHSVSAFANAGFSNYKDGLINPDLKYNYGLQLVIAITFILGGLGFPIVANIYSFFKYKLNSLKIWDRKKTPYKPWILNLNSRITLITTSILTILGFLGILIFEYNNTLSDDDGFIRKSISAFFTATTTRTAGFSVIDFGSLTFPSIMLVLLLMWIGAAPLSTGGGIKTSTFAIATLNIISLARGKSRIEVFRREISNVSVRRAFATISLSLIMIGLGITLIAFFNPELDVVAITFECFSAYGTVGLSMGITPDLSEASKIIISLLMLVGRVSMLSVVIALFKKVKQKSYRYPTEEIMIN
jgi:Trk-type K+ transport system membrane component